MSRYLNLGIRTSPHVKKDVDVKKIMFNVVLALLPVVLVSVYTFGLSALLLVFVSSAAALLAEQISCRMAKKENTLGDYSALITGILLGLTLPPGFPLWMAVVGSFVAIIVGKTLFGGLGFNVFNPALVGRAFLQAAFPVAITTWNEPFLPGRFSQIISTSLTLPFLKAVPEGITGATPLSAMKFDHHFLPVGDLLWGSVSGSAGETCAIVITLCGLYLLARNMLDWRIPAGVFLSAALLSAGLHLYNPGYPDALHTLFSGGLMLGAWFMATDMVSSPVTGLGTWIYASVIGVLTVIIRVYGGLPEGVMYSILIGNALVPCLNIVTQPKVYGTGKR